ncbi:aminotransferase [Trichloromonas acetexigens]|uniref:Aminotransferase n=1 Tax=Trichloromonas acetexigens TaxID=38815 RepID=A0A550JDA0_9BACT|nr:aminotransferase [Desulfuromonas acetexigens]TRO81182.1 aminotransferase [Desulfuromonas acetexigens]
MRFAISPHIEKVHFPPISEVKGWIAGREFPAEKPLVDLCQAVPDYAPAPELTAHLQGLLADPLTSKYSPDEGLLEARAAVCDWYGRIYGAALKPEELCLTIGASQAFWLAMMVLCQAGDEVVVQTPYYFDHAMGLDMLGIRSVYAPFDAASGGQPDVDVIARLITAKTRAILLVTPSNPTGAVTPPATLRRLFELARAQGIALVLDETYNAFIDAPPHDLFCDPAWGDHLVQIASFGKTFALTGYRAGALVASERFIHHALKAQDTMVVCAPRVTQQAIRYGVEHLDDWIVANRRMMQRRHDAFRAAFVRPDNPFKLAASGGFFAWVRHPSARATGRQVARRLADEANLICLPGEVFGPDMEGYLRLAFGNIREAEIPEAVSRFLEFRP